MHDRFRRPEARSLNASHLAEPQSLSDDAAYLFDAPEPTALAPSRPAELWYPGANAAMSVAIVDEYSFTRDCIAKSLQECDAALVVSSFATCDSCRESAREYDLILYHSHDADRRNNGDGCRAPFVELLNIAPVIVLSAVEAPKAIMAAFESGARGYIPTTDTTLGLALEIVRLVRAGGTFVPPSSLGLRRTCRRESPPPAVAAESFTPRQMAVLRHVKLGKANKTIARELDMSESTVKIHLRNIMKKMKAANRTEVACRAHALEMPRPGMTVEQG